LNHIATSGIPFLFWFCWFPFSYLFQAIEYIIAKKYIVSIVNLSIAAFGLTNQLNEVFDDLRNAEILLITVAGQENNTGKILTLPIIERILF